MFASMRSKKKCKDSPGGVGLVSAKTDQQQQQSRRKDAPEALKLPSPLKYYPGTQMPMDGWFHACRLCRCWTAFSATATTGELVPLCRRCLPSAARKSAQQPAKAVAQPIQQQTSSTASLRSTVNTAAPSHAPSKVPATSHRSANKMSDAAAKTTHAWANSYSSIHQQHQQYHQQAAQQQQQPMQQQQQRYAQKPQPGQAKAAFSYKAGSRIFKSSSNEDSYIAPSQAAAAAAAATAALGPPAVPASVPPTQPMGHQMGYARRSSNSSSGVGDRRSSTGDGQYAPCYKHLGPTNMHASAAPADTYITCLDSGDSDNGGDADRQQSGSDMLGAITSLLSDLYKMSFSGASSAASSRPSSRQGVLSRSNSGSRTTPAPNTLPI